jgi:two-component system response regulator AdeR
VQDHRREIIVIDDDGDVAESLATFIEAEGFKSVVFSNGADALAHLRTAPMPALILVDVTMPDLDGWGVLSELAKIVGPKDVPVFLMTAVARLDRVRAQGLGARGVLRKPFDMSLVRELLDLYLEASDSTKHYR